MKMITHQIYLKPGCTSIVGSGGRELGPDIKFEGKIWGKVQPSSPNERKTWDILSQQDAKVRPRISILGSYLKW